MPARRRSKTGLRAEEALFAVKQRRTVPHVIVLEAIAALSPATRSMFGCLAVYVADKICPHLARQARRASLKPHR